MSTEGNHLQSTFKFNAGSLLRTSEQVWLSASGGKGDLNTTTLSLSREAPDSVDLIFPTGLGDENVARNVRPVLWNYFVRSSCLDSFLSPFQVPPKEEGLSCHSSCPLLLTSFQSLI